MQPKGVPHLLWRFMRVCIVVDDHSNPLCRIARLGAMLVLSNIAKFIGTTLPERVMMIKEEPTRILVGKGFLWKWSGFRGLVLCLRI